MKLNLKRIPVLAVVIVTAPVFFLGYVWESAAVWFEIGRDVLNKHGQWVDKD